MTEQEFRNRLINILLRAGDMATDELNQAVGKIGIVLRQYRSHNNIDIWYGNSHLKKQIEDILNEYSNRAIKLTETNIKNIWELSEKKNDLITSNMMLGIAGATIAASRLYGYFNKILPENFHPSLKIKIKKSTIKDVINAPRNTEALNAFLNRKVNGLKLSERVWKLTDSTIQPLIESYIAEGIKTGASAADISRNIRKYLNNPDALFRRVRNSKGKLKLSTAAKKYTPGRGVYRSAYKNAMRLAREEINQAYRTADYHRWNQLDFVTGIKVSLSAQHPVKDICDELQGVYPKDFHFPGWHVQCLCHATPIMLSDKEYDKFEDAILEGKEYQPKQKAEIPQDLKKWLITNEDRMAGWKSKPYFFEYNLSIIDQVINK
jgi:hypothetical protein